MADIRFAPAWRRDDAALANDAKTLWAAGGLLAPEERERRVSELCALAYVDGAVAAVSTASLSVMPQFNARFAMYRCAVAPEFRRQDLANRITGFTIALLEAWSLAHPEEKVVGLAAILQAAEFREKRRRPMWPEWDMNLNLVGYTQRGEQVRVAWFEHALLEEPLN